MSDGLFLLWPRFDASASPPNSETCPNGDWLFSEARGYCDYPETVDCGDRPLCNDDDEDCEERERRRVPTGHAKHVPIDPLFDSDHVTTMATPEVCEGVECQEGDEIISFEPCSEFYCVCSNGVPYKQECADGTVYNPEVEGCDFPENNPECD